jgi:hypothetical protein
MFFMVQVMKPAGVTDEEMAGYIRAAIEHRADTYAPANPFYQHFKQFGNGVYVAKMHTGQQYALHNSGPITYIQRVRIDPDNPHWTRIHMR